MSTSIKEIPITVYINKILKKKIDGQFVMKVSHFYRLNLFFPEMKNSIKTFEINEFNYTECIIIFSKIPDGFEWIFPNFTLNNNIKAENLFRARVLSTTL